MPRMSFVVLSHENPPQVTRLFRRLSEMYGTPAIACHHDTTQSHRPDAPSNVIFVDPIPTGWGDFSLVGATLRSLTALRAEDDWEWVTVLSGLDYPVVSTARVFRDIDRAGGDAFIDLREVDPTDRSDPWTRHRVGRYYGLRYWVGYFSRILRRRHSITSVGISGRVATRLWSPFDRDFRCYAGSQWFTANRKTVDVLLAGPTVHASLTRRYRWVFCPDESYVHTVLANTPSIRTVPQAFRYADWSSGRPRVLHASDLIAIFHSGAWFARKFDGSDREVLDFLDRI